MANPSYPPGGTPKGAQAPYPQTSPTGKAVCIKAGVADPVSLSVTAGDTVVFTNDGPAADSLKFTTKDGSACPEVDSGSIASGATWSWIFPDKGSYGYVVKSSGSKGTVVVA